MQFKHFKTNIHFQSVSPFNLYYAAWKFHFVIEFSKIDEFFQLDTFREMRATYKQSMEKFVSKKCERETLEMKKTKTISISFTSETNESTKSTSYGMVD